MNILKRHIYRTISRTISRSSLIPFPFSATFKIDYIYRYFTWGRV